VYLYENLTLVKSDLLELRFQNEENWGFQHNSNGSNIDGNSAKD
jgi:hypothetical protein